MASLGQPPLAPTVSLQVPAGEEPEVSHEDTQEEPNPLQPVPTTTSAGWWTSMTRVWSSRSGMRNKSGLRQPAQVLDPRLYKSASTIEREMQIEKWSPLRRKLYAITQHGAFDSSVGLVISLNVLVLLLEANASADAYPATHSDQVLKWLNLVMLLVYTAECLIRGFVWRRKLFRNRWNNLDLFIVGVGWFDEIYSLFMTDSNVPIARMLPMLRILRIMRLVRAIRLLRFHPELYVMIVGFFGAMKAMLWGFVLIMFLLIFWSVVFVELLHPINQDLKSENPEAVNAFCEKAFSSVFHAGAMLFQTLVAGDSWGACSMPIIDHDGWTFFIFAPAVVSVTLGMMNLILGVIVDHAQSAREGDREEKLRRKKEEETEALEHWKQVLQQIDNDGDGTISYDEMMSGYEIPKVRDALSLMGIDGTDVKSIFRLIDTDGSGELDYQEFLHVFQKAQGQDLRIYLMMMQLQSQQMMRAIKEISREMRLIKGPSSRHSVRSDGAACRPRSNSCPPIHSRSDQAEEARRQTSLGEGSQGCPPKGELHFLQAEFQVMNASIEAQFAALSRSMERHASKLERHTLALEEAQLTGGAPPPRGKEPWPSQDLPDATAQPESMDSGVLVGLSLAGAAAGRRAGAQGGKPACRASRRRVPEQDPCTER